MLRELRKRAGLTQEQLALEAGIERNFVSLIERGINQPTIRILFKVAGALKMRPSAIIEAVERHLEVGIKAKSGMGHND
ncbi:helix-turn-helix domain-containing protein [Duganella sp. FT134W]|uniref:Helix-turn-helix domain-containing protein n=1 Tax=Duganella margarita TaxID=2692170 RepID=A0A7X4KGR1_9BURK|nr:helix-turn-helix domain-containing protein [Duganella margarita]